MTHLSDLIAALRKGDGNGCERSSWLMQEAADALMANQGAIVNSIIERTRTEAPRMVDTYDDRVSEVSFDQGWAVTVRRHWYGCNLEWERRGSLDEHLTDILPSEALVFAAAIAGEVGNTSGEVPEPSAEDYPDGWFVFGSHAPYPWVGKMEFSAEKDEAGMPLWERPVQGEPSDALALADEMEDRMRRQEWLPADLAIRAVAALRAAGGAR